MLNVKVTHILHVFYTIHFTVSGYNDVLRGIRDSVSLSTQELAVEFECYYWSWVTGDIEYQT